MFLIMLLLSYYVFLLTFYSFEFCQSAFSFIPLSNIWEFFLNILTLLSILMKIQANSEEIYSIFCTLFALFALTDENLHRTSTIIIMHCLSRVAMTRDNRGNRYVCSSSSAIPMINPSPPPSCFLSPPLCFPAIWPRIPLCVTVT